MQIGRPPSSVSVYPLRREAWNLALAQGSISSSSSDGDPLDNEIRAISVNALCLSDPFLNRFELGDVLLRHSFLLKLLGFVAFRR